MSNQTYLFYDIETSGLSKCFDQVLQFAAIRTDLDLNEIERHELRIKLNPDVLPAPGAILTHNIGIEMMQQGESELVAIQKIHGLLNKPGTISVGYNTLGFDDEFLRFSFYRNLLPAYTHQYANNCARMDIYPITLLYYLFKNEALIWPMHNDKVSLRLENINAANQLATGDAHDAMVDVEVTLALAKRLKQHETMWKYVCDYFNKTQDLARLAKLTDPYALIVEGKLGSKNYFQASVLHLGQHNIYKNQSVWLRLDQVELQTTHADAIDATTSIIRKRAGEAPLIMPPKNRFTTHLSSERKKITNENLTWLQSNPTILQLITDYYLNYRYPEVENLDADAALYQLAFATQDEEKIMRDFHHASPKDKLRVAERFQNPTRKLLATRIIARHFPEILPNDAQNYLARHAEAKDYRNQLRATKASIKSEIATLLQNPELSEAKRNLLLNYQQYISNVSLHL